MKINVIISADYIREDLIKDKVVVVIDILRATSVIVTAFMNGCKEVIPLLTVEEAFERKNKESEKNYILGGERKAVKIEGFDYSNSPLEYKKENVEGRSILLTTTNGTRALTSCLSADKILIASMLNGKAVAKKLLEIDKDIVFVNAGTSGEFSMDDFICTGYIVNAIVNEKNTSELTDIAKTALTIYKNNSDIISYIKDARHYNRMISLGLQGDIEYCIQKDKCNIVPKYTNGRIIKEEVDYKVN